MQLQSPKQISRARALRYMGAADWQPDAATTALLDKAETALLQTAAPRGVWRQLPLAALPLQDAGRDLARHLQSCHAVILLGVTLGSQIDSLLRRMEVTDIALAAAADAMASVLLEQASEQLQRLIAEQMDEGQYLTGCYAPGYGDCPLELNDEIARAADTVRGCGLAVTPQHLLTPRKSMTGILGVADHPVTGAMAGCATCHLRETCAYRKRGTTCGNE